MTHINRSRHLRSLLGLVDFYREKPLHLLRQSSGGVQSSSSALRAKFSVVRSSHRQTIAALTMDGTSNSSTPVREGKAVLSPDVSTNKVFYNPVQEFNRDLSCLVLSSFFRKFKQDFEEKLQKKRRRRTSTANTIPLDASSPAVKNGISVHDQQEASLTESVEELFGGKILDVMAATGLRTCRYALEVPHVTQVVANDYDPDACEAIRLNALANNVENKITVFQKDARQLMLQFAFEQNLFHAVDLDPFGSAAPFFEGALQCIADGGLLMVTCTDTAILCGNYPEACFARYGSTAVRNPAHHEMSLRIVLNTIASRAMQHEKHIRPLLSLREGHYIRLFLSIHNGAHEAKDNVRKIALVFNCPMCHDFHLQPFCDLTKGYVNASIASGNRCDTCGSNLKIGGPIWSSRMHDVDFVNNLIKDLEGEPGRFGTEKVILGKLGMVQEELPDQPLYLVMPDMFKVVHCKPIPSKTIFVN